MDAAASEIATLHRAARRLRRRGGGRKLPALWAFTDPERTPDPVALAETLPGGAGLVYRAFGAADAEGVGRRLAAVAARRGLTLLIGADAELAEAVGAHGVHLPERAWRQAGSLGREHPGWILTAAAHSRSALTSMRHAPLAAVFVSPVFASASPSAGPPIGPARLRRWVKSAEIPVIALGGVTSTTLHRLARTKASGVAAVGAFARTG